MPLRSTVASLANSYGKGMVTDSARLFFHGVASRMLGPVDRIANSPFYHYPFGRKPLGDPERYRQLWDEAKAEHYDEICEFERQSGYAVDQQWLHDLALRTQIVVKSSKLCYQHGRLLYSALSSYVDENPAPSFNVLETGTARGFSSLCMAKALEDRGCHGKLITVDVLPHNVKMYWNCIADEKGPLSRAELLAGYEGLLGKYLLFVQGNSRIQLEKLQLPRVHFAFLDGAHTYQDVMHEFRCIEARQQSGDIIFFDDYSVSMFPGVVRAVDEACGAHGYRMQEVKVSSERGYVIAQKM